MGLTILLDLRSQTTKQSISNKLSASCKAIDALKSKSDLPKSWKDLTLRDTYKIADLASQSSSPGS